MSAKPNPWYQETIIYELHVRTFADGNGDGIGDFKGLTARLDYLQKLGVGALWLLPFYPSPLRDAGYDVTDYVNIHPDCGTMVDFRHFLREAHDRGLRVITEMVLNHTSDQHRWFKRACASPPGSVYRDFYVWSDTPEKYPGVRIIFNDFEESNWTWNAKAKAYYWHRFYYHQPDLNFDNPHVRRAIFRVVDFWLGMGVDGMRLDAVPYLIEREGTSCENLPETHVFLKELREHIDARFPDKMLLAEANLWPEDAISYFGAGDECHMAFHFPLMPRIFMSMWMEDSHPIRDIIEQTPDIPESCRWGLFLRNHDELTLEMISDDERDYMYRAYARDEKARINMGIRRRLAPLLGGDRRKMELMYFLLFSFPGVPILYYGDEIGMGDNLYLGDRAGVRTPMQWTAELNAGFSTANPQSIFPPLVIDPAYHYRVVNVEAAERIPSSFLWWIRRLIAAYKAQPTLAYGDLSFVATENGRVLAFLRVYGEEKLLVVVNLSRFAQGAALSLEQWRGCVPVDVFGHARLPVIGEAPYCMTLGPHDYFWLRLETVESTALDFVPPVIVCRSEEGIFSKENVYLLERRVFPLIVGLRKGQPPTWESHEFSLLGEHSIRGDHLSVFVVLAEDSYESTSLNIHLFLLACVGKEKELTSGRPVAVLPFCPRWFQGEGALEDGFAHPEAVRLALSLMASPRLRRVRGGALRSRTPEPGVVKGCLENSQIKAVHSTAYTATYSLDQKIYFKFYLRPSYGPHPEVEMMQYLRSVRFPGVPRLLSTLSWEHSQYGSMALALATEYVQGARDGEVFVLEALRLFFEEVLASSLPVPQVESLNPFVASYLPTPEQRAMVGRYTMEFFRNLGMRAMELHCALASFHQPGMAPEPLGKNYLRSLYQTMRNRVHRIARQMASLSRGAGANATFPLSAFPSQEILERLSLLLQTPPAGVRLRVHGDFRLGSVLHAGKEFVFVNFDGDGLLPVSERMVKHSPLRDISAMLFSIGLTADTTLRLHLERNTTDKPVLLPWLAVWRHAACNAFINGYYERGENCAFLPSGEIERQHLLEFYLLERIATMVDRALEVKPEDASILLEITHSLLRVLA